MGVLAHLRQRGLVAQVAGDLEKALKEPIRVYLGSDPSAPSLHLGNLLPVMLLAHLNARGHTAVPLVGGATGSVGDPSGRKTERSNTTAELTARQQNVDNIGRQLHQLLSNSASVAQKYIPAAEFKPGEIKKYENNRDWWANVRMLDFLQEYGRHIRLSAMLGRESVRQRLGSQEGIGYAEFSYQILQAFDFWWLYSNRGVTLQLGGDDQWGNITAGMDLIGRLDPKAKVCGLTAPLLLTPSGEKFGKSAGNAVFLDAKITPPFHLYQHLVRSPDEVVGKHLRLLTFVPLEEIDSLMKEHEQSPDRRVAQHRLAAEICGLVHGAQIAVDARLVSSVLYDSHNDASPADILSAMDSQSLLTDIPASDIIGRPWKDLVSQLSSRSKSESQRLLAQGAVYSGLNRHVINGPRVLETDLDGALLLLRIGKAEYHAIRLI